MDLRLGSSYTYGAAWESSPPSRASRFRYHSSSQVVPFLSAFRTRESPDHRDLEVDSIAQSKCREYHRYLVHFPPAAILCRRCDNVDWKPFPEQGHFRARNPVRCWERRIGVAASARVLKGERDEEAKAKQKHRLHTALKGKHWLQGKLGRPLELYLDCAIPSEPLRQGSETHWTRLAIQESGCPALAGMEGGIQYVLAFFSSDLWCG